MEFGKLFFGIIGLCLLSEYSDAAITAWTNPVIAGAASGSAAATPTFAENLAAATTTGITVAATTDAASISTYTLTTATVGGATFTIANSGLITFASGTLDFETNPTLIVVIEAADNTGAKGTATVTLSVTNVDEAPVYTAGAISYVTVPDGSGQGTAVTTLTATDPEGVTVVGYTIASGNTNTDFAIVATSGAITVATGKTLASATTGTYILVITSTDGTPLTGTATLAVIVGTFSGVAGLTVSMMTVLVALLVAFLK